MDLVTTASSLSLDPCFTPAASLTAINQLLPFEHRFADDLLLLATSMIHFCLIGLTPSCSASRG
jgi:hypothetical protein